MHHYLMCMTPKTQQIEPKNISGHNLPTLPEYFLSYFWELASVSGFCLYCIYSKLFVIYSCDLVSQAAKKTNTAFMYIGRIYGEKNADIDFRSTIISKYILRRCQAPVLYHRMLCTEKHIQDVSLSLALSLHKSSWSLLVLSGSLFVLKPDT